MLKVSVVSPEATLYDGDATSVVAPAYDGEVGILSDHAPMIAVLGQGTLRVEGDTPAKFTVSGGFVQVVDNTVRVVTERAARA